MISLGGNTEGVQSVGSLSVLSMPIALDGHLKREGRNLTRSRDADCYCLETPVPSIIPILGLMMRKKTKVFGPRSALYTLRVTRAQIHEPFTTVLARPDDEALRICVETLRSLAREGRLNT